MTPLSFGIIGSHGSTQRYADALRASEGVTLTALADLDTITSAQLGGRYGVPHFDDVREALVRGRFDAVILALSPATCERLLPIAAQRGAAVILDSPPVRSFSAGAAIRETMWATPKPIVVSSRWRFDPAIILPRDADDGPLRPMYASINISGPLPTPLAWRGDRVGAGGGVLMTEAYESLDILTALMGRPSDVFASIDRAGRSEREAYDVEDAASLLFRYADGRAASVAATWGPGRREANVSLVGTRRAMRISDDAVEHFAMADDNEGTQPTRVEPRAPRAIERDAIRDMCDRLQPRNDAPKRARSSTLMDHLETLAVIETAYLSARTGAIESVEALVQRQGVELTLCERPPPGGTVKRTRLAVANAIGAKLRRGT